MWMIFIQKRSRSPAVRSHCNGTVPFSASGQKSLYHLPFPYGKPGEGDVQMPPKIVIAPIMFDPAPDPALPAIPVLYLCLDGQVIQDIKRSRQQPLFPVLFELADDIFDVIFINQNIAFHHLPEAPPFIQAVQDLLLVMERSL